MGELSSRCRGRPAGRSVGLRPVPLRVTACRLPPLAPAALRLPKSIPPGARPAGPSHGIRVSPSTENNCPAPAALSSRWICSCHPRARARRPGATSFAPFQGSRQGPMQILLLGTLANLSLRSRMPTRVTVAQPAQIATAMPSSTFVPALRVQSGPFGRAVPSPRIRA